MNHIVARVDALLREWCGLGLVTVLGLAVIASLSGAGFGMAFPKYQASGLFRVIATSQYAIVDPAVGGTQVETIALPEYKRLLRSYGSGERLRAYLEARHSDDSSAVAHLKRLVENGGSWIGAIKVDPLLPFAKSDQREFGELKGAGTDQLIGISVEARGNTPELASGIVQLIADYLRAGMTHERVQEWVVDGKARALTAKLRTQADILNLENELSLIEKRIGALKQLLTRYPQMEKLDMRPLIPLDSKSASASENLLPPLVQLVGAETSSVHARERVVRLRRYAEQRELLLAFFTAAESTVKAMTNPTELLTALRRDAEKSFPVTDSSPEWVKVVAAETYARLDRFKAFHDSIGMQEAASAEPSRSRSPLRLAALSGAAVIALVILVALGRGMLRAD